MRLVVLLVWSALFAVATRLLGWWTVPIVGALAPLAAASLGPARAPRQGASVARGAALAAALGWGALLAWAAGGPQFRAVGALVGGILRASWPVVALLTLLLPAVLAWCAAALAEGALALASTPEPDATASRATLRDGTPAFEPRSTAGLP
jgi:hypothetical protein